MYHATMTTISAEQTRDIRDQATAWRRAHEARGPVRPRPMGPLGLIVRNARSRPMGPLRLIVRNARSLTGQKRQGSAAA